MSWHTTIEPQRPMSRGEVAMTAAGRSCDGAWSEAIDGMGRWPS
jgi:hypothetical protein